MKYTMRDYQRDFCRETWRAMEVGVDNEVFSKVLGCAATGAGKTIMATALVEKWKERGKRSLFLADTDELCSQAVDKMFKAAGIIADLEKAESRASRQSPVVVGSIQTMAGANRIDRFKPNHFDRIIADEAHLSLADNWQRVLNRFHEGGAKILGITATPERGDGLKLMDYYEHLSYEIPLKTLIERRHLSPIMVRTVPIEITVNAKITDGEMEDLGAQLGEYFDRIIEAIDVHARDRKAILVFHASCKTSKAFTERLQAAGISARHVDGNSPDRREILAGFSRGDFRVLNNAQLLMKGYDEPIVDAVVILRPTKSRTAFIQMVGRGTRLFCPHGCGEWCDHPDRKSDMLLLDFLWQFPGMNVMGPACLVTDNKEQAAEVERRLREGGSQDLLAVDDEVFSEREEMLIKALKRASSKRAMFIDARQFGAMLHQPELMDFTPTARWERAGVSDGQTKLLEKFGIDARTVNGRGHASKIIDAMIGRMKGKLATPKQVALMIKLGIEGAPDMTFEQATRAIDEKFASRK